MEATILEKAKNVRLVIFDVDGVLTDGTLFLGDSGEEYKSFYSRDGLGMKMLQKSGIDIGIITGRTSQVVVHRMRSLGIQHVYQGKVDKLPAFKHLCEKAALLPEQIAYVGDDVVDVPVMKAVGLSIAVGDAHPRILPYADWQTTAKGGRGAAREVCELLMQAQDKLDAQLARYAVE